MATRSSEQAAATEMPRQTRPSSIATERKGAVLRPSPLGRGLYGIDLTAGCSHGCGYCHIRASARYPGEGVVYFDPATASLLVGELDRLAEPPAGVILSPSSDPLPPIRAVREATFKIVTVLLRRGVSTTLMTRGRIPRALVDPIANAPDRVQVAVGLSTLDRQLSRALEPGAAHPRARLAGVARLASAGVEAVLRLEPLIPGLTDTAENLSPLLAAAAEAGIRRVVAHSMFLHPSMRASLAASLAPLGLAAAVADAYEGGPVFAVGSLGMTRHLPLDERRSVLARVTALGARHGLVVETGSAQNPDLRSADPTLRGPRRGAPILVR